MRLRPFASYPAVGELTASSPSWFQRRRKTERGKGRKEEKREGSEKGTERRELRGWIPGTARTDGQKDRRTPFSSLVRAGILCSED